MRLVLERDTIQLCYMVGDIAKQISELQELEKSGKTRLDSVSLGKQDINTLILIQGQRLRFLIDAIASDEFTIESKMKELKSSLCPSCQNGDSVNDCQKDFLTRVYYKMLEENYGT